MPRVLIVYASTHKQTEKIAFRISDQLSRRGLQVSSYDIMTIPEKIDFNLYDALIVGAPVRMQNYSEKLRVWVKNSVPYFFAKPTAFFSVCLGIMDPRVATQRQERKIVSEFLQSVRWSPDQTRIFAGALMYSKYNFFLKLMMWWIAWRSGSKTSIFVDQEFTNWNDVKKFADQLGLELLMKEKIIKEISGENTIDANA